MDCCRRTYSDKAPKRRTGSNNTPKDGHRYVHASCKKDNGTEESPLTSSRIRYATQPYELLPPEAHVAAKAGEYEKLEEELKEGNSKEILTERDQNGWQVLHQGVTSGSADVVELLVDHGADINARTRGGYGDTPLRIAEKLYDEFHPIVEYLKNMGALSIGPEL